MKNFQTLIERVRHAARGDFMRHVAALASGTAAAQALTIAFAPLITRLYGPEAFGVLGTFTAVLAVLTPIAALAYPIAIVLPREDRHAAGIARLALGCALGTASLVLLLVLTLGTPAAEQLGLQAIAPYLLLLPLGMLLSALVQISEQWLVRKKKFYTTARVTVLQSLLTGSAKVGFGWVHPSALVLVALTTLGNALHAVLLARGARAAPAESPHGPVQPRSWRELARLHRDFPLYRAPQVFLNALSQSLPVVMLASLFGPAAAGFYALARTVLAMPSTLIGKSVLQVFYPRITEAAHRGEDLPRLIVRATLAMAAAGFVPFALIAALGPWLFALVFGSNWSTAGEYAQWLSVWLFFGFLNRPSVAAIPTLSLQGFFLLFEVANVALRAAAIAAGFFWLRSDLAAVAAFSLAGAATNLLLVAVTVKAAARHRGRNDGPPASLPHAARG